MRRAFCLLLFTPNCDHRARARVLLVVDDYLKCEVNGKKPLTAGASPPSMIRAEKFKTI
jgi:hypothetical protein